MKKRIWLSLILALVMMFCVPASVSSLDSTEAPVLSVYAKTLDLENSIDLVYYVSYENVSASDVKLLAWSSAQTSYTYANAEEILSYEYSTTLAGKTCLVFKYTGLSAKEMAKDIYVRPYAQKDSTDSYGELTKYSVLQYAFNKLAKAGTAEGDEALEALVSNMLDYGASAQTVFNYETNRLANADFYQVKLNGGLLPDLSDRGLYLNGDQVVATAPAQDGEGNSFNCWADASGNPVSTSATYTFTLEDPTDNIELTAIYGGYFELNAINGTFANGSAKTSVADGTQVTLTAGYAPNGYTFSHWENSAGETVGTTNSVTLTATKNDTYKAYYVPFFGEAVGTVVLDDLTNDWQQGGINGSFTTFSTSYTQRVSFAEPYFLEYGDTMKVNLPKDYNPCPWETDNNDATTAACANGCDLTAALLVLSKNETATDSDVISGYTIKATSWNTGGFTYTASEDCYIMVTVKYNLHGSVAFNVEKEVMQDVSITVLEAGTPVPLGTYWEAELEDAITKIETNRETIGDNIAEFFFMTDTHWYDNAQFSPALVNYIADRVNTNTIIFDGDVIKRYNPDKQDAIDNEINGFYGALENYTKRGESFKIMSALGNHDRNGSSNCPDVNLRLTEQEAYDLYLKRMEGWGTTVEGDPNKCYFDDTTNKIRYIQFYFAGSQHGMIEDAYVDDSMAWAEEKVLELDSDWTVVLFTHGVFCGADGGENEYTAKDEVVIKRMLQLQGNADAEIAIWMTGHIHEERDEILYDENGNKLRLVSINCDAYGNSNTTTNGTLTSYSMIPGTVTEQSFSFIQIDKDNETIYLTRVGAGTDKTFTYGSKLGAGTDPFFSEVTVKVINGTIDSKSTASAQIGSTVTMVADTISGYTFSHWVDKDGATVASTATATITVTGANTYRPVYTSNTTLTPADNQVLYDLANDWQQGSFATTLAKGYDENLRGTRISFVTPYLLKAGEKITLSYTAVDKDLYPCPWETDNNSSTTAECTGDCVLQPAYAIYTKNGNNTGDMYQDYTPTTEKCGWGKSYTNNTGSDVYIVFMLKYSVHGNSSFNLSNAALQNLVVTVTTV